MEQKPDKPKKKRDRKSAEFKNFEDLTRKLLKVPKGEAKDKPKPPVPDSS